MHGAPDIQGGRNRIESNPPPERASEAGIVTENKSRSPIRRFIERRSSLLMRRQLLGPPGAADVAP